MKKKQEIIIRHYREGESERSIARILRISRTTVRRYIEQYKKARDHLMQPSGDDSLTADLVSPPTYDSSKRHKRKLTQEIAFEVDHLLSANMQKRLQGQHKQQMKKIDILEFLQDKGYDIGYTTICNYIGRREEYYREAFIRQVYSPGDVCEFDWGEVKLTIASQMCTLYMAVFTPANSNYRFARLFYRQDTASFLQAHADFFDHTGGAYRTMVYDNMRVAIRRFVGHTEKQPTQALLQLSMYYQFGFRFCNIGKGNEKGHVEKSVEFVRRKAFCRTDSFDSLRDSNLWLQKTCNRLNTCFGRYTRGKRPIDLLDKERPYLAPAPPPFDCAFMEQSKADKYSVVTYMSNRYSVPDYLVGKIIDIKVYPEKLVCYYENKKVCKHERRYGNHGWYIELDHYLRTLGVKPGALAGSQALATAPAEVREVFEAYFVHAPKDFVELLIFLRDRGMGFDKVYKAIERLKMLCPRNISLDTIKALCLDKTHQQENVNQVLILQSDTIAKQSEQQLVELSMLLCQ
jgi:transposase